MLTRYEINLIAERVAEILNGKKDELLTAKSCAALLGISIDALHKRCERGTLPCHRKHKNLYFFKNELSTYLKSDDIPS